MLLPESVPLASAGRFNYRKLVLVLLMWTLLIGVSAVVNYSSHAKDARIHAAYVADAYIEKDLAVRRWITRHGGVYVRPTEKTPPNVWLDHPKRDVETRDGMALTMVNPAYATRQLHDEFAETYGIRGHLTALKLKNPDNAPDDWERATLLRLESGEKSVTDVVEGPAGPILRTMRPVLMEHGCLNCHADMGIPLGGVRGGLTTSVPLAPFMAETEAQLPGVLATHGTIWLAGLVGIGWGARRNRLRDVERAQAASLARREARRVAELMALSQRLNTLSERELIQEVLGLAERLTESKIAYCHFVNDDQTSLELVTWSKSTLEHYCHAVYDRHYPLDKAGIWADCARQRQAVIHNDYPNAIGKRGLPDGHAELIRHLAVPVLEGAEVRLIGGIGNKAAYYDDQDRALMQATMDDLWSLILRKRASDALQRSEQRLREAQQLAGLGSWEMIHADGSCLWSDEMFGIFGVDRNHYQPSREAILQAIHPDDRALAERVFQQSIENDLPYQQVLRLVQPGGLVRHVLFRAMTERQPDGVPVVSRGTAQDITEQRELERLRQSKGELTALFENTDRWMLMLDAQCRLVIANSVFQNAIRKVLGRRLQVGEILPAREWPPEKAAMWRELYRRGLAGEQFSVEIELDELRDDRSCWINFSFFPIVDEETGKITGLTVTGHDHTERRELDLAQRSLLAQKESVLLELKASHVKSLKVNRLNDLLQSCRSESEAYQVVALSLGEIFPSYPGCFAVNEASTGELRRVACWGEASPNLAESFVVDDCWALRRGEPHEVLGQGELYCRHFAQSPAGGYVCLPLMVAGETLGLISLEFPRDCEPERLDDIRDSLQRVAETIKLSLANLRLRIALEVQATRDPLTGLFNRRYMDSTLPRELHRESRNGGRLTVAMLDIDHFKRFNDDFGHEAGDRVLSEIGLLLQRNLRKSDIGCRYGGEELLLIMPDASIDDAHQRLLGICAQIRAMRIPYRDGALPQITVSVGIASLGPSVISVTDLLRAADEALYQAKAAGRDRVVLAQRAAETGG